MISTELREEFTSLVREHVPGLRTSGSQATGRVPWREDKHPSLSVNLEKAVWYDLAQKEGGGVKEFKARLGLNGAQPQGRRIVATYDYTDEYGTRLYQVVRYEPKDFRQRRSDGNGGWFYNLDGVRRVLYRLPEILQAQTVFLVEGEKHTDRLWSLDIPATTNPQGAGKWCKEYNEHLAGKQVVILPDNDEVGERHGQQVAQSLRSVAASVKIVRLPGLPPKGDVIDWLDAGHTKEELLEIVEATPILKPQESASAKSCRKQSAAVLTRISDVRPSPIQWLWPNRIPVGKLTILDGDPGLGKSLISLDLSARVTRYHPMPDGAGGDLIDAAGVVILSVEDDLADTIHPRLEAAGADLSRVVHLTAIKVAEDDQRLPELSDLEEIRIAIEAVDAKLVIVDPLMAYLPGKVDSYRDQDVRRVLAPLAALAAETGVAVLVVRHLNKTEKKNILYRGGGSIAIIGAARSGLLVARDPDDPDGERCVLATTKANLSKHADSLAYKIEAPTGVPCVTWGDVSAHTAETLLVQQVDGEEQSALDAAKKFLTEILAHGPQPARDVQKEAKQADITAITLRRARIALGIKPAKEGGRWTDKQPTWRWALPEGDQKTPEGAHIQGNEHLQQSSEKNTRKFNGVTEGDHFSAHDHLQPEDDHLLGNSEPVSSEWEEVDL